MTLGPVFEQNSHQLVFVAHHIHLCFYARCLMSHIWLHTPDCKVLNEMKTLQAAASGGSRHDR